MAAPMSPLILSFPVMYAVVGFCSPATIFSKFSSLVENVQSASPAPSVTVTAPSAIATVHTPAPSMSNTYVLFIPSMRSGVTRLGRLFEELLHSGHGVGFSLSLANGRSLTAGYHRRAVDFDLTPEQELIRDTVRTFARERVEPVAADLDSSGSFPYELVSELGELGLMGLPVPEQYGGAGGDTVSYAIAIEELTRIDSSVAITVAAHTSLGTMPILLYGSDEQKERWLPDLASGRKLAAFGLTEADAGSDAGATRTTAELRDGSWVVNGSKLFITNAGTDVTWGVTITARTGEDEISNLVVENGTPGYTISAPMKKLGWRASDTRELAFEDCAVPGGQPPRPPRRGLPTVPRDPRRRAHLRRGDGGGTRAGRLRPRVRVRAGARAVRQADRVVPGDPLQARRHGDGDRGRARDSSTRPPG